MTGLRHGSRLLRLALLLAVLCCAARLAGAADIISSSRIESCIADGSQGANASAIACSKKLVVVLTVDSGDAVANQELNFQLSCIGSPTGVCPCPCNYAADPSCTCRDLATSLSVTVTKSPLWASYPLLYLQSFNYKPYESIVRPGAGNCQDGNFDLAPTCGWYYSLGQKVPDSQGFVCECEAGVIWDSTFGVNTQRTRANLDCDFFSDPLDIIIGRLPCSAHCLMMDPHWYGGYSLGESSLQFEISATLTTASTSGSTTLAGPAAPGNGEVLSLSPSVPVAVSTNRTLSAKLLGDLAGYTQLPVLSERVLMIPHPKTGQTLQEVFNNRSEWMLLDRSRITFDGSECDKVGASFTAFRYQAGACRRAPQVCLSNQIRDLLDGDRARIAQGRSPLYLVSQYTYGLASELKDFRAGALSFALPVTGIRSSVVQLEAAAESLRFVTNNSPGKILDARMCTFAETRCGGFEASAATGYLHAWLANTGTLPAAYTVVLTDCSLNIRPVDAVRVALAAGQNGTITPFRVYVEDDAEVAERSCWLKMLDATGLVTDARQVKFFTNATAYEDWPSGGLLGNGTGEGELSLKNCSSLCPNRFDVLCAFKSRCWGHVGSFAGLLLGTIAGVGLLLMALKLGWISSLFALCCGGGGAGAAGSLLGLCGGCCGGSERDKERERGLEKRRQQRQQEKRHSAGGNAGGKGGRKGQQHKGGGGGRRKRGDGSGGDSSSAGRSGSDFEADQQLPAAGGSRYSSRQHGRGEEAADWEGPYGRHGANASSSSSSSSSTSRRPSAAAAAAAAAASGGATTTRRRSRQPSGSLSASAAAAAAAAAEPSMFVELDDPRQAWGSGAGNNNQQGFVDHYYGRPHSSSGGGAAGKRVSGSSRMQPLAQPWDAAESAAAAGGYGSSAAAAAGYKLRRPPSAAAGGSIGMSGGVGGGSSSSSSRHPKQQRRSSSAEPVSRREPQRQPRRSPGGHSAVAAGFDASGSVPIAMWNPVNDGDHSAADADADDAAAAAAAEEEEVGFSGDDAAPPAAAGFLSPPRRQFMSSPGGPQQQQQQQQRYHQQQQRRVQGPSVSPLNPRDVFLHIEGAAADRSGVLLRPVSNTQRQQPSSSSGDYSDSGALQHQQHQQMGSSRGGRSAAATAAAAAGGQSALRSFASSPGSSSSSSPVRTRTPGRAVMLTQQQSSPYAAASGVGGLTMQRPAAAAAAAGPDRSSRRSSAAVSSGSGLGSRAPSVAVRASSAAAAAAAAAASSVHAKVAAYEQYQQVAHMMRSPFAAAAAAAAGDGASVDAGGGRMGSSRSSPGGSPQQQQQQQQQQQVRRMTLQPQQQQSQQSQQQRRAAAGGSVAAWDYPAAAAAAAGPRSPSQRPRSSSSNSSGGGSSTGLPSPTAQRHQRQQQLHTLSHSARQQPQQQQYQQQQYQQQYQQDAFFMPVDDDYY